MMRLTRVLVHVYWLPLYDLLIILCLQLRHPENPMIVLMGFLLLSEHCSLNSFSVSSQSSSLWCLGAFDCLCSVLIEVTWGTAGALHEKRWPGRAGPQGSHTSLCAEPVEIRREWIKPIVSGILSSATKMSVAVIWLQTSNCSTWRFCLQAVVDQL